MATLRLHRPHILCGYAMTVAARQPRAVLCGVPPSTYCVSSVPYTALLGILTPCPQAPAPTAWPERTWLDETSPRCPARRRAWRSASSYASSTPGEWPESVTCCGQQQAQKERFDLCRIERRVQSHAESLVSFLALVSWH